MEKIMNMNKDEACKKIERPENNLREIDLIDIRRRAAGRSRKKGNRVITVREMRNINKEFIKLKHRLKRSKFVNFFLLVLLAISIAANIKVVKLFNDQDVVLDNTIGDYNSLIDEWNSVRDKLHNAESALEDSTKVINELSGELADVKAELISAQEYINTHITAPDNKEYTPTSDLGVTTVMDTDRMNRIIDYWLDKNGCDSPFKGQGEAFIKASQETGLDPIFIFAIASHESYFGTSNIAKSKGNYMGIGAYDNSPYTSAITLGHTDVANNIVANAKWIAEHYYNQGQTTLNSMIYGKKEYSTSKDHWIGQILSIMKDSDKIK